MTTVTNFTPQDHRTWQQLFHQQAARRDQQLIPEFSMGLQALGIGEEEIPDLAVVNSKLNRISGWQAVYTPGFVEAADFFKMLSEKKFPIGHFIRDPKDLSYTPAPDVFHDLYGHIPFYTIPAYGKFCQQFGAAALKYVEIPGAIEEFQRFFWFTIEFALVKTKNGTRIFGAGIASSYSECEYALSQKPRVHPFDIETIRQRDFRIDIMQEDLYILESADQLYDCLPDFERKYQRGTRG